MHSRNPLLSCMVFMTFAAIGGCAGRVEVGPPIKWFHMNEASTWVSFRGQWQPTARASGYSMNWAANTVRVTCDRESARCEEVLALLYAPNEHFPRYGLELHTITYTVSEWTDNIVRARSAAPAGDFELRISLADKVAERSFRETKDHGLDSADPSIVRNWVFDGR